MPKKPENEDQAWALAYALALFALTINGTLSAESSDRQARLIADQAIKTLKEREIL